METKINKTTKHIVAKGNMSNLVGMYAVKWHKNSENKDECSFTAYIYGKADDEYFIVQAISALCGSPNACCLKTIEDMKDWTFYPDADTYNFCMEPYWNDEINKFSCKSLGLL